MSVKTWKIEADPSTAVGLRQALGRLGAPEVNVDGDWRMARDRGLWRLTDRDGRVLRIDFDEPGPDYFRRAPRGRGEILARAMGRQTTKVADLSAGLGQDAVFLCGLGFTVIAIERHPVLALLLQEAQAASRRPELARLTVVAEDARQWMDSTHTEDIQAGYFDPMYPHRRKSALPRQEMVMFRSLVGDDGDATEIAQLARRRFHRLVVKRPDGAPPLLPGPTTAFVGKAVRYDVYVR